MRIEEGLQVNCSELIIRINDKTTDEIKASLKTIGIREAIIKGFYYFAREQKEWDTDEAPAGTIIFTEDIPAEVIKLYDKLNKGQYSDKEYNRMKKKLAKLGYDNYCDTKQMIDENVPIDKNKSSVYLYENFDDTGKPAISGHQHCQTQLFPIMKKISDHFGEEVEGYDGGSMYYYEQWIEAGCPNPETWEPDDDEE